MVEVELDPFERELILKYGYPFPDLQSRLEALSGSRRPEVVAFSSLDVDMVTGDLSRSINHGEVPDRLLDAVDCLCSRLEVHL